MSYLLLTAKKILGDTTCDFVHGLCSTKLRLLKSKFMSGTWHIWRKSKKGNNYNHQDFGGGGECAQI